MKIISKSKIIGTISFGGKINERSDTLDAENPKPLKPLTKDANSIIEQKNKNSKKPKLIISKTSIKLS